MSEFLFSVLHTSARPDAWRAVYHDWMGKAVRPEQVEYVLCVDPRWGFDVAGMSKYDTPLDNIRVVLNNRRRCYVDGVKLAAEWSTGSFRIVHADDQFACQDWDYELSMAVNRESAIGETAPRAAASRPFIIEVSTGTPNEHDPGVLVMPILSRARYQAQGFVFS